jgi:phosphatidylserine synthase
MVSRVPYPHLADWLRPRPAALAGLLLLAVVLAVAFGPRLMFVFVALGYVICGLLCEVSFRRRLQTH